MLRFSCRIFLSGFPVGLSGRIFVDDDASELLCQGQCCLVNAIASLAAR
jgi:hypothetical protein